MEEGIYYPYTTLSQGTVALDEGRTSSLLSDLPPYPHAYHTGLYSSLRPDPIQRIGDGEGRIAYPESDLFPSTLPGYAGMCKAPKRWYSCDICGKQYSQRQGVSRHHRKAHNNPYSCFVLRCKYKWTRPDQYRTHLENCHPDVDRDYILGKPAGSRCGSTIIGRDLPQHFYHPRAIEPDQRSRAEPRLCPVTPYLPALAKVTHVPSPAMSPVAYDPQPEYAEPSITTSKREDYVRGLDFFGEADGLSTSSSTEQHAQSANNAIQHHALRLPPARPGGSTTTDSASGSVTAIIPALTPPMIRYYNSSDFVDPVIEPSGPIYPNPFSVPAMLI